MRWAHAFGEPRRLATPGFAHTPLRIARANGDVLMEEVVGRFVCAYWACGAVHEFAHLAVATGLGRSRGAWHWKNMLRALFARQVDIPMAAECKRCRELVRHAGWIASLLFAG